MGLKEKIQFSYEDYQIYHCRVMRITENVPLCLQAFLAPSRCSLNGKCLCRSIPALCCFRLHQQRALTALRDLVSGPSALSAK